MKNVLKIQRDFGEVIIEAALPSLEDFCKKVSNNQVEGVLNHIPRELHKDFYCAELTHAYMIQDFARVFGDFYKVLEKEKLFQMQYHFGAHWFCNGNELNMLPFFSRGISSKRIMKFQGLYSEDNVKRAAETIRRLLEYVMGFRNPVTVSFDIEEDKNDKPTLIKL